MVQYRAHCSASNSGVARIWRWGTGGPGNGSPPAESRGRAPGGWFGEAQPPAARNILVNPISGGGSPLAPPVASKSLIHFKPFRMRFLSYNCAPLNKINTKNCKFIYCVNGDRSKTAKIIKKVIPPSHRVNVNVLLRNMAF